MVDQIGFLLRHFNLLNCPFPWTKIAIKKIISKILPFVFLISLINIFVKYELNNELIIFWLLGINKIKFTNTILKISVLYFFLQLSLTSFFVPYSLDKARSFFRNSNVDLFTSIFFKCYSIHL